MDHSRTYPDVDEIVVRFHGPLNWHLLCWVTIQSYLITACGLNAIRISFWDTILMTEGRDNYKVKTRKLSE
jgi:hypothetical protein